MALSEHEQRLLDEMERSLYQTEADFVAPSAASGRLRPGALAAGVILGILGVIGVVAGVGLRVPVIGIVGFALMVGGVLLGMRRESATPAEPTPGSPRASAAPRRSFMSSLEDRWERRRDERDEG